MKDKKAIYIIGGGSLGINIIRWAKELDLITIVTDKNSDAPGFSLADETFIADGTDIDAHINFAKQICKKYKIVGVYCGSEFGVWTIYHLSIIFGIETNSKKAVENVLDKTKMNKVLQEKKIPTTKATLVHDWNELNDIMKNNPGWYVIKPTLGSGSRGVQIIK